MQKYSACRRSRRLNDLGNSLRQVPAQLMDRRLGCYIGDGQRCQRLGNRAILGNPDLIFVEQDTNMKNKSGAKSLAIISKIERPP